MWPELDGGLEVWEWGRVSAEIDTVILMGVSGCGKSSVGELLADRWGGRYFDGDDYHPPGNVEKMGRGEALVDEDRWPWFDGLRERVLAGARGAGGERVVLACSALRAAYRERLVEGMEPARVLWVFLKGDMELIRARLDAREGHYMKSNLLESQFETLEEPNDALAVGIDQPVEAIVDKIIEVGMLGS